MVTEKILSIAVLHYLHESCSCCTQHNTQMKQCVTQLALRPLFQSDHFFPHSQSKSF